MMQQPLRMLGGWLNPVSVDNKDGNHLNNADMPNISLGQVCRSPPPLYNHRSKEAKGSNCIIACFKIQVCTLEEPIVIEMNSPERPLSLVEGSWEMPITEEDSISDFPSMEELAKLSVKCRNEKCLVHAHSAFTYVCNQGLEAHEALGNYLVPMFVDCGSVLNAHQLFNKLSYHNEFSWTCLIQGYVEERNIHHAFYLHQVMQEHYVYPSTYSVVALLTGCVELQLLAKGQQLHAQIAEEGLDTDINVGNTLANMYANCGLLQETCEVLNTLPVRDVVSWTTLISAYTEQGLGVEALNSLEQMQSEGVTPNSMSYVCILKACGSIGALINGHQIHTEVIIRGLDDDIFIGNVLIDMYMKCLSLAEAQKVFNMLPVQDVVSWTTLIAGYVEHGPGEEAWSLMEDMQCEGVCPNSFTLVCGLKACCNMGALDKGQHLHAEVAKKGLEKQIFLGNIMVDLYSKQGLIAEAWNVLMELPYKDVYACTALINGLLEQEHCEDVLESIEDMREWGTSPNDFTLVCGVKACSNVGAVEKGRELHLETIKKGYEGDLIVDTALMDMYAMFGLLAETSYLFERINVRDVVSWNIILMSFVEHRESKKALDLYAQMKEQGCLPDDGIVVSILKWCGVTAALDVGKRVHAQSCRVQTFDSNVASALIDMYGKCGNMVRAQEVFDGMPVRDLVVWSSLITGYAREGDWQLAIDLFDRMMDEGIRPDRVAFLTVLSLCNHIGLLDKARHYFESMTKQYAISPTLKHSTCLIDLLGHAGHLDEAVEMVDKTQFSNNPVLWITVLGACQKWKDVVVGRLAFTRLVALGVKDPGVYVTMSNIYVDAHMWEDAKQIDAMRMSMWASESVEKCWIEIGGLVHEFVTNGVERHPQNREIVAKLELSQREFNVGVMPKSPLETMIDAEAWRQHSEMMAVACGLVNSHEGMPLYVVKNTPVGMSCHKILAFLSQSECRTLIFRDTNVLHVFKDGNCVCGSFLE